jgi:hypothetical protein
VEYLEAIYIPALDWPVWDVTSELRQRQASIRAAVAVSTSQSTGLRLH